MWRWDSVSEIFVFIREIRGSNFQRTIRLWRRSACLKLIRMARQPTIETVIPASYLLTTNVTNFHDWEAAAALGFGF